LDATPPTTTFVIAGGVLSKLCAKEQLFGFDSSAVS
jgi:hypothetical protein